MNKYLLIIIAVLIILILSIVLILRHEIKENRRYSNNLVVALKEQEKANKESMRIYIVKQKEMENLFQKETKLLKENFNLKIRQIEQMQFTNTTTTNNINTILKDTLIQDSIKIQYINYEDMWQTFKLYKINDSIKVNYITRDSLVCVLHKNKKTFKEIVTFKKRYYINTIKSFNPNTVITYNKFIKIEK